MSGNPYGIMNDASYNYFSHIRHVLFEGQEISTRKSITYMEYLSASETIALDLQQRELLLAEKYKRYKVGSGFDSIIDKIAIDNMHLAISAMRGGIHHDLIQTLFYSENKKPQTFARMIDTAIKGRLWWHSTPEEKKQAKEHASLLKSTINDDFLQLRNKHL